MGLIKKFKMQTKTKWGFTLIEMIVVIAIIGILSTILLTSVSSIRKNAIDTRRKSNLENVRGAINMYYSVKSTWPSISGGWSGLMTNLSGYITDSVSADEDGDGVADYSVSACTDGEGCQMKLYANCVQPTASDCVSGRFSVTVK